MCVEKNNIMKNHLPEIKNIIILKLWTLYNTFEEQYA